jgi:hypothetical protein
MKKTIIYFTLLFLVCTNAVKAQQYAIGHISTTFTDSSRNNRSVPVEIYYPADNAGDNVPFTTLNNFSFPVLSFGHGFVMTWDAYQNVWTALVPSGYIIIFPKTEGSASPSHNALGLDLAFCVSELNRLNAEVTSPFYQRVDSMNCVMGHSMGGGAAHLAAANSTIIKSIATLAAAETNPSAINAAGQINVPGLVIAGGNDCITPPLNHQIPMYDSLASTCKNYISINGGSHCQMANSNFLCNFGELTCTPSPAISRTLQHQILFRYLLPWLNYHLKNDCNSLQYIDSLMPTDSDITFVKQCNPCSTTGINQIKSHDFTIYPNPVNTTLTVNLSAEMDWPVQLNIIDLHGRTVLQSLLYQKENTLQIGQQLKPGYYTVSLFSENGNYRKLMIKL